MFWCVLYHLGRQLVIATLLVEGHVSIHTGQPIAPAALTYMCEGLDDKEAKLLVLVAFGDGDILNMTDAAKTEEELAMDEDSAYSDDLVACFVEDDDGEVCARGCAHGVELIDPYFLAEIIDDS